MPYLDTLQQSMPYSLEVGTATKLSLTVINIRRDRISEVESLTFDSSTTATQQRTIGTNIGRLVFLAHGTVNSSAVIKIAQGAKLFEVRCDPDGQFSFDVA